MRRHRTPSKGLRRGFVSVPSRQDSSRNRRVTKMWSVVALSGVKVHGILVAGGRVRASKCFEGKCVAVGGGASDDDGGKKNQHQ